MNLDENLGTPQLDALNKLQISHEELGENKEFKEAQQIKNEFYQHAIELFRLSKDDSSISGHLTSEVEKLVEQHASKFSRFCKNVDSLVAPDTQRPSNFNFGEERNKLLGQFRSQLDQFLAKTQHARTLWRVNQFEKTLDATEIEKLKDRTNKLVEDCELAVGAAKDAKEKTETLLNDLGDKIEQKTIEDAVEDFGTLASTHKLHERIWTVLLVAFLSFLGFAVFHAHSQISQRLEDGAQLEALTGALLGFKNLLLISIAGVGVKIALTKYNVERNLHVIYRHRETALSQYNLLKDRLDDPDSKRQLLLEVTRLLFADPATGLTKAPPEVNVNPVLNVVEKALG